MNHSISQTIDITFFWWAFAAYGITCLTYVAYFAFEKRPVAVLASVLMGLGLVMQTSGIISRALSIKRLPLTNMFEYISLLGWFAACLYFVCLGIYKLHLLGAIISFAVFMLMVSGSLLPKDASAQLVPALQSYWLQIHVTAAALAEAAFLVAFAANILYLLKNGLGASSRFGARLPDAQSLDRIAYKAITIGYPLFTVGALFAGAIWAEKAWGAFWSWDPKEVGSLIVWLVYSAYLHARFVKGWVGTRAALLSMAGFLCTLATFFANLIFGGLHAYG
jgi:cytochrome c-type biogenesis protein CcsB